MTRRYGIGAGLLAPLVFTILHFTYGIRSIKGVLWFVILRRGPAIRPEEHALSRWGHCQDQAEEPIANRAVGAALTADLIASQMVNSRAPVAGLALSESYCAESDGWNMSSGRLTTGQANLCCGRVYDHAVRLWGIEYLWGYTIIPCFRVRTG